MSFWRVMTGRRRSLAARLVAGGALAVAGVSLAPAGTGHADTTTGYWAQGTVSNTNAPVPADAQAVPGEDAAFVLSPVVAESSTAQPYITNNSLEIVVTPSTNYYVQDPSTGYYKKSTYTATVVQGDGVEASGRFVNNPDGTTTFFATYVWNPPPPTQPQPSGSSAPPCGTETGVSSRPFLVVATVQNNRMTLPCTGIGNAPVGFAVDNPTTESAGVATAFSDYNGVVDIAWTATTKYIYGNTVSTWAQVVAVGNTVEVWGNYVQVQGAWYFEARLVWSPPPGVSTGPTDVVTDIAGTESATAPGSYSGNSYSGATFNYTGTWTCSPDPDTTNDPNGTLVQGNWQLAENSNTMTGTFGGTIDANGNMSYSLTVSSGTGFYNNANGGGSMTGTTVGSAPGVCPTSFPTSKIVLSVVMTS